MKKVLYYILLGCMLVAGLPACTDEPLMDGGGEIPEGETTLSAVVNFKPFGEALTGKGRSAGNAIKSIDNLCVLFYVDEGEGETKTQKLVSCQYYDDSKTGDFKVEEVERKNTPATSDKEHQAEAITPQATISKLVIPYGKYYVYVVANMGDLNAESSIYKEAIQTAEGLKNIQLTWQYPGNQNTEEEETTPKTYEDCVKQNNQMFGYFTTQKEGESVSTSRPSDFDAPLLTIDRSVDKLHAWIRRAASKVTVAYDGSKLKDNVRIYIHSVQIKDIPKTCFLGAKNTPSAPNEVTDVLINEGEIQYYREEGSEDKRAGLYISNGPNTNHVGSKHEETEPKSLFFYENMQGDKNDGRPNKYQDKNGNNASVTHPGSYDPNHEFYKDKVKYGSYIEVKGYYESKDPERYGNGPITYRFMLGKDIHYDYNAERNYHYKLTLKFNGYANDVDWHIEYEEPEPGVYVNSPYYISYLYDRTMNLNVKVVGEIVGNLKAEIIENNWKPLDPREEGVYYTKNVAGGDENGFLSLRKTNTPVIEPPTTADTGPLRNKYNKDYYEGAISGVNSRKEREYEISIGTHPDATDGDYTVTETEPSGITQSNINDENSLTFEIPLYTRARSMVTWTGYSGNNIYVAYQRKAKVRFTAKIRYNNEEKEYSAEVDIIQGRRIVNPKGVWRAWNNNESFQVRILYLPELSATEFKDLISDGPWRAEVVEDLTAPSDWLQIQATGDTEQVKNDDGTDNPHKVKGADQTKMEFKINIVGTLASADATPRCGAVRLYYNNYTCVHLIFVKQGYAPLTVAPNSNVKWHSFNVTNMEQNDAGEFTPTEATDPRDEGNYFKWRQPAGILASNNRTYGWEKVPEQLALTTGNNASWDAVKAQRGNPNKWGMSSDAIGRIAEKKDYMELRSDNNPDDPVQYGFGVLYADGATDTQYNTKYVNQYYRDENWQDKEKRGMRGCFVYNKNTGNNIFFPIGAEGHGRRKDDKGKQGSLAEETSGEIIGTGILRYANRHKEYNTSGEIEYRPFFFDLYRRPGAVYWCGSVTDPGNRWVENSAWDINYYTLNFDVFTTNAYAQGSEGTSDACLIRLVDKE